MAATNVDTMPKTAGNEGKLASFGRFIYNHSDGTVMERGGASWAKIGLFYLIFYSCLAGFFAASLAVFFVTVDANYPSLRDMQSLLKANPGMGFRPMPDVETTLIRFKQGQPESYKKYADHIQAFVSQYENDKQVGENYMECSQGKKPEDNIKVCRFNRDLLGKDCTEQKDFGYGEGRPCVLLKLNKIYDWQPDLRQNHTYENHMRTTPYSNEHVGISCEGENPADKENLGEITFMPSQGMPSYYFPYLNQENYRQPIVMAQFKTARNGVLIQVWCKAWANNIYHHKNDKAGSVHFELLMD